MNEFGECNDIIFRDEIKQLIENLGYNVVIVSEPLFMLDGVRRECATRRCADEFEADIKQDLKSNRVDTVYLLSVIVTEYKNATHISFRAYYRRTDEIR